ncbi:MAG TPA: mechanosensitive ion channel domain-containing protein, partial [Azospirillaceae bacterium]|nr:mechanosensitive ion channel domain-containing protein [Azospirillaceae bacterium]
RLRLLTAVAAVAMVVLSALRYHALGLYIGKLLVSGAAVGGLVLVVRGILREMLDIFLTHSTGRVAQWRRTLFAGDTELKVFGYVSASLIDLTLMAAAMAAMLPLSGIKWNEVEAWGVLFLRGFSIGSVTIAPLDILAALMVVIAVLAMTRLVQRRIDERVLERLNFDRGVRHSIRTGIGYVGVLLALITGIGALGLNLSSLAMIASALSVGIGFGLQAVVSNFVAGLILLVERPVKVGDWVVIGDKEGVVKRISVRSTEIQTFQRASVIIPNAELISGAVVNWTHKDKVGRIDIPVGVSYDADVELVRQLLLEAAVNDPRVAKSPAPMVAFHQFGDNALNFELRCFVHDVDVYMAVATDLRFAILKAFRTHKVEIPYMQQVIHIPQLDRMTVKAEAREEEPAL